MHFRTVILLAAVALPLHSAVAQHSVRKKSPPRKAAVHKPPVRKSSMPADNVQWLKTYSDKSVTVSIDPRATTTRPDGSHNVHLRWQYATDQRMEGGKRYRTMVEHRLLQCDPPRSKPVDAVVYSATGKVVSSYSNPESSLQYMNWSRRVPNMAGAQAFVGTCNAVPKG